MRKLLALFFILFLILVAYWADTGTMPGPLKAIYLFPNGDRLGHVVLYGMLTFLLNAAWPRQRIQVRHWRIPIGTILATLGATLEELSQFLFPSRTPDVVDWACGLLGILVATWFGMSLRALVATLAPPARAGEQSPKTRRDCFVAEKRSSQ